MITMISRNIRRGYRIMKHTVTYFIFQREKWEINYSRKKTHIPWTSPTFTLKKQLIIVIIVAKVSLIKKDYAGILGKCMNYSGDVHLGPDSGPP